ncbi:Pkinase-domain-containing protein [Cystobasidium minutum MCA 4210]|uniref:Pkinase-domain-containing protein n=1 Tax=Cystobasidium minutum MCA 4210 TaxID=1397322 RepID=UPI0034CD7952|eukprot:jgi/Rhomi1/158206/estExt_Genewise1Plus.C_2_t20396
MVLCTPPPAKPAPASAQLPPPKAEKPGSIPTCAKFLADGRLNASFEQQYEILDELGSGGFGFVIRARRRFDGLIVAVKFIFRERPADGQSATERLVPLEAYVLRLIRHPGVVAFLDLIEDESVFYLVMEHHGTPWQSSSSAPGSDDLPDISFSSELSTSPSSSMGPPTPLSSEMPLKLAPPPMLRRSSCDLFECIEQHTRLPEEHARLVFGQIVEVVYYLACMGICHRDIKDENIVVDSNFRVKLIDFGSAIIYDPRKAPPYHNRFFGTVNFAASEILQGQPYRAPHAEVWSLGVLLSILLTGETPFTDPNSAIQGRINKPKCRIPDQAIDLMIGCLDTDPETRLTISQVREHPWLQFSPNQ